MNEDVGTFTRSLKNQDGRNIWMVGGSQLLQPLLQERLVDEFIIQIAPSIIGKGIPLFLPGDLELDLTLVDVRRYHQFAELRYEVKKG